MPNVMFHNRKGQHFEDVTFSGGFGHLQKGHGIAFADLDLDGDQEVIAQMGGFFESDKYSDIIAVRRFPGHAAATERTKAAVYPNRIAEIDRLSLCPFEVFCRKPNTCCKCCACLFTARSHFCRSLCASTLIFHASCGLYPTENILFLTSIFFPLIIRS